MDYTMQRHIQMQKTKEQAKQAMLELIASTNAMGHDKAVVEGMVEALRETHRTLQQNTVKAWHNAMMEYANFNTDARNDAAVRYAKRVSEIDTYFPFI